jgi:alkylhydroperoxidase family enzyme
MASHIRMIPHEEATGFLKKQFDEAVKRAGRIWNIVGIMSQNPRSMKASMDFYGAIMFGGSPLSRSQRETLAVVTSAANHCVY